MRFLSIFNVAPKMHIRINLCHLKPEGKEAIQRQVLLARANGMSLDEVSKVSPVSRATMFRWTSTDMSPAAQKERQIHPRRQSMLKQEEQDLLIQSAKERRTNHQPVSIEWTRQRINEITGGRVAKASNGYISKFWSDNGWPSRKAQERNQKEVRPSLEQEVELFRREVTSYVKENNIPPSRIFTMDETGLWNGSVAPRTYVDPETMDASVVSVGNHRRDTGVVSIAADGRVDPYFIEHSPQRSKSVNGQRVIVQKGVAGMGNEQMAAWTEDFGAKFGHPDKTVLLMDRLRSHQNKKIQNMMEEKKIKCFFFPPQGSKMASVCDNPFFGVLKARLQNKDTSTTEKKREAFVELCKEFPPEMIKSFYDHCGWNFLND